MGLVVAQAHAQAQTGVWSGLLNYWPFDEGTGVIAHDTTGHNNGTLTGFQFDNSDGWRKGRIGPYCLKFDGKDDSVDLANPFALPDYASISAWVNVQGFTSPRFYILDKTTPSPIMGPQNSIIGYYDLGTSTFVQNDGSVWNTDRDLNHVDSLHTAPGIVKDDGKWHQIAFVRGNWFEAIYVDGVKRAWGPLSIDTYKDPLGSGTIGSGSYRVSPTGPSILCHSNGLIDDVRVYNRLLPDNNAATNTSAGGDISSLFLCSEIAGDADLDGQVSFSDYQLLEQNFGQSGAFWTSGDFNYDGKVSFADYQMLEASFGESMPEPGTLCLLGLGGLALTRRRRAC